MNNLIGTWKLQSWTSRHDGGVFRPGGQHPQGDLIYTADRRFSVHIASDGRPVLGTVDPRGGDTPARAAAFATYIAYCGRYELDGNEVVHHVEASLIEDWVGGAQRRRLDQDGDVLTLTTPPMLTGGLIQVVELVWQRRSPSPDDELPLLTDVKVRTSLLLDVGRLRAIEDEGSSADALAVQESADL